MNGKFIGLSALSIGLLALKTSCVDSGKIGADSSGQQMEILTRTPYKFYNSAGEGAWKELAKNVNAHYLSTSNSHGITGTTIGKYATKNPFIKDQVQ